MTMPVAIAPKTKGPHFATLAFVALPPEEVGQRITQARKAKGWTHNELARQFQVATGRRVDPRTVQRWQKGRDKKGKASLPRLGTLMELADVLGVPTSHLVEQDADGPWPEVLERLARLEEGIEELLQQRQSEAREGEPRPAQAAEG